MGFGKFLGCVVGGATAVIAAPLAVPVTAVVAGTACVMAASEAKSLKAQWQAEGYKMGYENASTEYEKKLWRQAEEFLKQKQCYENISKEREMLIDEYEEYIRKQEAIKDKLTEKQKNYISQIKEMKERLKKYEY